MKINFFLIKKKKKKMLELVFILTTILFGCSFVLLIRQTPMGAIYFISLGWIFGSLFTGYIVLILTHFIQFSFTVITIIASAHLIFALLVFCLLKIISKNQIRNLVFLPTNASPWIYSTLAIICIFAIYFTSKFYSDFPKIIPKIAKYDVELEYSVILSIIQGCNVKHPRIFFLEDPFAPQQKLNACPSPLCFSSCLMYLSGNYADISLLIVFFNTFATVCALYMFTFEHTKYKVAAIFFILFNSSWGFVRYFRAKDPNADLVFDWGRLPYNPFYQIFFKFLISSKTMSFSLPCALFSIILQNSKVIKPTFEVAKLNILSGVLAAICPSFMASASLFIFSCGSIISLIEVLPFAISLLYKMNYSAVHYMPVWKEWQMNGVFFSQIWCWFDAFGPVIIGLYVFPFFIPSFKLLQEYLVVICLLLFNSFFRNGGFYEDSALAVASTVFPFVVLMSSHIIEKCINMISPLYSQKTRGYLTGFSIVFLVISCYFGIVSINRQINNKIVIFNEQNNIAADMILRHTKPNDIISTQKYNIINPVPFITGRQILGGNSDELWRRGENFGINSQYSLSILYLESIPNFMKHVKSNYLLINTQLPHPQQDFKNLFDVIEQNQSLLLYKLK